MHLKATLTVKIHMKIIHKDEILNKINYPKMYELQKKSFFEHYQKNVTLPPVGFLSLAKGDLHIKFGYIKNDPFFLVKLVSGFPKNFDINLPTSDGCSVAFCSKTGILKYLFLDEGYLTDYRTVLTGCLAVETLNSNIPKRVGIIGAGRIARLQAISLYETLGIKEFTYLARRKEPLECIKKELSSKGLRVKTLVQSESSMEKLLKECHTMITTTPSKNPILDFSEHLKNHLIVAIGSDEKGKQELDSKIMERADLMVVDDRDQCKKFGELQHLRVDKNSVCELGEVLWNKNLTVSKKGLRVCDLTGLAVQDVQVVKYFIK